jgi:hypothetical protein
LLPIVGIEAQAPKVMEGRIDSSEGGQRPMP